MGAGISRGYTRRLMDIKLTNLRSPISSGLSTLMIFYVYKKLTVDKMTVPQIILKISMPFHTAGKKVQITVTSGACSSS